MSRHKIVKNMDLDDELDDFDGGVDYNDNDGDNTGSITDKQIQDALWHYYYDVEKSVGYLVNTHIAKPKKENKKSVPKKSGPATCSERLSFADFFKDMPWLNTPVDRQAIFVEPLYLRGGLLGGSSDGAPKLSKLQILAAARKKKAQEQKSGSSGIEKPMSDLAINESSKEDTTTEVTSKTPSRGFPLRKRKDSNPHEKHQKPPSPKKEAPKVESNPQMDLGPADQAEPSAFASTMFSSPMPPAPFANLFTLSYTTIATTATDPFAGPSPDDVVIAAQSKANGKGGKGPPKTNAEKKADQIATGVEALKVDDTPRARSKNLDVLKEWGSAEKKNEANFVVIGHVDAGKSTLMGRLLYDLKVVDQRTIDRYRSEAEKMGKSSFALAWVLDQGSEERARGVTIDIATNKFFTDKTNFTILDAPGHRDFIPNMIAGASQADFAVLVIDASTGSFESGLKGQTKEHALLVRSMGVQRVIIAVNKLDTVSWSEDRFTEISQQISAFLTAAGFLSKNITFIPCSGLRGDNIVRRSTEPELIAWYNGPTIVEELDNSEPVTRALTKPLRLTIGDIFRGGVQNPLSVSGRIESGSLQAGDALLAQPAGQKCFIRSIEIDNEAADWAVAGQNVTLHLSDIDPIHLKIGDVLSSPSSPIQNVKRFTAKVLAFEFLMPMQIDVHRGRLHTPGRITEIIAVLDKGTGAVVGKKKPRIVKPGAIARVVVDLETAVPLEAPGRVVLRAGGETVGAGLLELGL
ncbi:hbs1 [Hyphodiscus hymeniophilus]|uniref:Elongation factor 1 alpha-like protein n=1 Tax=Hyphodiscus hymeniophilus TaxID=353542 RepID=A0A9P6SL95_9HELO|nr:hbs1 [Hyphodiscus hymeniophilus]